MTILREWRRPSREAWWALVGFSVVYVVVAYSTTRQMPKSPQISDELEPIAITLAYTIASALLAYRVFAYSRLLATPDGLIVDNPFRSEQRVDWGSIEWMRADRLLTIGLVGGGKVTVWVVQKNGWHRARHERSTADEVIDELSALATAETGRRREFARA